MQQHPEKSSFGGLAAAGRCPGASCPSPRTHLMLSLSPAAPGAWIFQRATHLPAGFPKSSTQAPLPPSQAQTLLLALQKEQKCPVSPVRAVQGHSRVLTSLLPYSPSISQGFQDLCSLLFIAVTLPSLHTLLGGFAAGGCAGIIDFLSLPHAHPMDRREAAPPEEGSPGPLLSLKKGISLQLKPFSEPSAPFPASQQCPQLPALRFYSSCAQSAAQGG